MHVPRWVLPFKTGCMAMESESLSRLYEFPARHWPDKCAITDGTKQYTFLELFEKTNNLAALLAKRGVKKGDRVMVVAEKCIGMAVIIAAIWKTGAVFVPTDPANPVMRNDYLLNSISPALLLAPGEKYITTGFSGIDMPVLYFDDALNALPTGDKMLFDEFSDTDLVYIMHTSGSTGNPKGVMIEHESVLDYFYNHNLVLQFTEKSFCLSNAPFYFDVSIEDTMLPLSVGASVYQFRGLPVSPIYLNILSRKKITHLIAVSTILKLITGDGTLLRKTDLSHLEMVMTGAEVCDVKVVNAWKETCPGLRLYNVYGPTEATIVCTAFTVEKADHGRSEYYPIGKPLNNVKGLLMDNDDQPITKVGAKGNLWIGGKQVMRGYWNDEWLSRKVLTHYGNTKFYKTGDLCYYDNNGDLVFCGRNDDEIKLNGRRINLMEIKQSILEIGSVFGVAAGMISANAKKTLGVVVWSEQMQEPAELQVIREKLSIRLPLYMIPEYYGLLNEPMVAATGKNDEKSAMALLEKAVTLSGSNFIKIGQ